MIVFRKVSFKNFLSYGNVPTEVDLSSNFMTLIVGSNGSGKSSITEAICYALYGKAYRNVNKPNLINSINQKHLKVEILFDIGKKKYKVVRGMKPNIFEIYENDKLINQDPNIKDYQKVLEQQILKMNYRAFTQVVVMGTSAHIPFMKLTPAQRREFIEDLLDIRVFSIMNSKLKDLIKTEKERVKELDIELKGLKEKAVLQDTYIKRQKKEHAQSTATYSHEISDLTKKNDKLNVKILKLREEKVSLDTKLLKYDSIHSEISDLKSKQKLLSSSIENYNKEHDFYSEITTCPTCRQGIDHNHKGHILAETSSKIKAIEDEISSLGDELVKAQRTLQKYDDLLLKSSTVSNEISEVLSSISLNNQLISKNQQLIDKVESNSHNVDNEIEKLKELAKVILSRDKERKELLEKAHYYSAMSTMLQDSGIKAKIIKQYIPIINKLVNKYLDSLDFFVSFNLDEEFNEVVKSRYRDEFVYDSFSEGQKQRIDLAMIFTWRDIARLKNSVSTNLVIFDELLDSALDGSGLDLGMKLLNDMKNTNVFVISHREGAADKFNNVLQVTMKNNFSVIE